MELKRKEPVAVDLGECSFNRTFMELKPQYCCVCSYEAICFNRTFMELKHWQRICMEENITEF